MPREVCGVGEQTGIAWALTSSLPLITMVLSPPFQSRLPPSHLPPPVPKNHCLPGFLFNPIFINTDSAYY